MTPVEAVQLCRLVKACCPSQVFDEFTPTVWAEVLDGYSYADAKAVVMKLVATPVEFGRAGYIASADGVEVGWAHLTYATGTGTGLVYIQYDDEFMRLDKDSAVPATVVQ